MTKKLQKQTALPVEPRASVVYLVRGYHTGDFIGDVEVVDRDLALVTVVDPLRPREKGSCPFPQCLGEEDHDGTHIFATLHRGARIEVPWRLAKFEMPPLKVIEFRRQRGAT